jgi:hypothetical protein
MVKPVWETKNPVKKHHQLSSKQKGSAKAWAKSHNIPYPSLVANMHAMKAKKK